MSTATLLPLINFHGFNPDTGNPIVDADAGDGDNGNNDLNGFWPIKANTSARWEPVGTTDIGAALATSGDGKSMTAQNNGTGVSPQSAIVFADAGAIPNTATITSIQVVIGLNCKDVDLSSVGMPLGQAWGAFIAGVPWTGAAFTNDFSTGAGFHTYTSDVMTTNPSTGLAWVFADLYGQPLAPFTQPKGFQGWWGFAT